MIRIHPGFPLTQEDYGPLLDRMRALPVTSVAHLEDNLQGAVIELTDEEFAELSKLGS